MGTGLKKSIGPGLVMAAAAIGVSHLVQSTRAGAEFGYALVWAIMLANLFKYPFLEFGSRYAIATGKHMIHGYAKLGRWALWAYILFTVGTMFAIQAAVTIVTASLAAELTGIQLNAGLWSAIILGLCILLLIKNSYAVLDSVIKLFMIVLAVSTLVAVVAAVFQSTGGAQEPILVAPEIWTVSGVAFLIALMGWMPIPIDASVWHSIWTLERIKQTRYTPKLRESLIDFNIGYIGAALFALGFLVLGAEVMFGSGEAFAASGVQFSQQLINLYTVTLGDWAYLFISACAFSTMFSTTFTVTDTYPRVCSELLNLRTPETIDRGNLQYRVLLVGITATSVALLFLMGDRFRLLIDLATTLSFLTAPVLAYINYRLIFHSDVDPEFHPPGWLHYLAICGLFFLTGFALFYIYWMIGI
ncbi:Nramp family divalent metal transporter [Rhodohalobacter sp. 8-1]|uniref:Nramp family divalent metal transporter n=1 Tax=Rhodohalobacter sp. 8-1 TaxID=3131972 RepID=UPI0030EF3892